MKSKLPIDEALYEQGYNQALKDINGCDWQAFRREAANVAMSGMMANADFWQNVWSENRVKGRCDYPSEIAHFAIACADELIKLLKQ